MSVVSIFHGAFCRAEEVADQVAQALGYEIVDDGALVRRAVEMSEFAENKIRRVIFNKPSVFNRFSHEKERCLIQLKRAMASILQDDELVYLGYGSQIIPKTISHILRVCLIAETKRRVSLAASSKGLSEKDARALIHKEDESAFRWTEYLSDQEPWAAELYDVLIPMDHREVAEAAQLIIGHAKGSSVAPSAASHQAVAAFALAAEVEAALARRGHNTRDLVVSADRNQVTIEVNKKVIMLSRLEEELSGIALQVTGVEEVSTKPGPGFYQADVYRRADFQLPSKVLLVDDEREFVETLSERLLMRDIGSAVVYDGEEALRLVSEDEPEVVVLDLKMPGIDGIEVLRRIKRDYPLVEVIVLTGHGSEKDRDICMQLGAFTYLEKPVEIEELSAAMQQAYDKIKNQKA